MRKVDKTIALPIYYSLHHDKKNWLLRLYFMHSYCMKLFYCKNLLCLRKERLHIPTFFFYFLFSAPAFLVPATVSCARIPGVFINNRMCLININTFFLFNLKYVADLTFILRPFWLGTDLTGIHANPRETKSDRKDAKWCILLHFGYKICLVKTLNRRFATSW